MNSKEAREARDAMYSAFYARNAPFDWIFEKLYLIGLLLGFLGVVLSLFDIYRKDIQWALV